MPPLKEKEIKQLVLDTIMYTDDLDDKGRRVRRSMWSKNQFRPAKRLVKKLVEAMELGTVPKDTKLEELKNGDVQWIKNANYDASNGTRVVAERHTDEEIEIDPVEMKVVKSLYKTRQESPDVTIEALDMFEAWLEGKHVENELAPVKSEELNESPAQG